jgi:urease accessory protein
VDGVRISHPPDPTDGIAAVVAPNGAPAAGRQAPATASAPINHQRANGRTVIAFRRRGDVTALHRLFQEGSAKVLLPRLGGAIPEAVLINTAGGLASGDRFANEIVCEAGARAVVTTQACERVYRSNGVAAAAATRIALESGSALDWLPQETILFDGGRLERTLDVEMAADAALLATEAVIFGRTARGETVRDGFLRDRWRVRRAGRLVFADDLRFAGPIADLLARPAILNGHGALATALLCAPDSEARLPAVRDALGENGGASAWDGKLLVRAAAADGFALRRVLLPVLSVLTDGRALPKVWNL